MNEGIKIETTENGAKIFYSISNYEINRRVDIMLNELDKMNEWILHNENEAYLRVCLNRLKAYENMRKELNNINDKLGNALSSAEQKLEKIKFYIEQSDIKNMLWGKEILKIIGDNNERST